MPNRHPLSRVPAFASIALRQPLRGPSNRAYVPKKIHPWIFFGSEICKANLRGAKPPLHGLFNFYQVRKSIRGFFWDCKTATQFCMLLSRPSMGSVILFKYENPSWIFGGLQNRYAILHAAKSPILGLFNSFQVRKIPHLKKNQLFLRIYVQFQTFTFYILYGGKNK